MVNMGHGGRPNLLRSPHTNADGCDMAVEQPYPDLVVHNAQVLTLDRSAAVVEALAVKGERIVAIGPDAEVLATAGSRTRRLDLGGRTVVPGFCDAHAHLDREGLRRAYPDLQRCRSIADVQAVVSGAVAGKRPGEWAVILPLGEPPFHLGLPGVLAEGRFPDRWDLDAVAPDNPVWVRSLWAHWSNEPPFVHVLNSAALRACGIGPETGRIVERFIWPVAEFTLLRAAPRFDHATRARALAESLRLSLAAGTTSVYEGHGIAAEVHRVYKELHDRGALDVRTCFPISPPPFDSAGEAERLMRDWAHYAAGPGFGDDWLKVSGIFLECGGTPEVAVHNRAAWPYTGWAGFTDQHNPPDQYRELCRLAAKYRLRVNTIISRGADEVLTIWEEVDRERPIADLRWVLVHAQELDPARDFPRIKRLGAVLTTQPSSYIYRSGLAALRRGVDEDRYMAYRDYVEHELPWALSTDNKPYWMLWTLWCAVARREMAEGRTVGPGQRIGALEALRAMSLAGAYVSFEEHRRGSLEVGKLADLVVLSGDPLTVEADELKELQVDLTMVGGRIVHGAAADE
jgi:predicted amidohydrolase YtcJ